MGAYVGLLSLFATPLGSMINKGIAFASASAVTWTVSKGLPADSAVAIFGALGGVVSTAISALAATQGIKIAVINADDTNGVKVVPVSSPTPSVDSPRPATRGGPHG